MHRHDTGRRHRANAAAIRPGPRAAIPRLAALGLALLSVLVLGGVAGAVPPGMTITFPGGTMGPVTLDGAVHAEKGLQCPDCHTGLFEQRHGAAHITFADHTSGKFCYACHDGKTAFAPVGNCNRCHAEPQSAPAAVAGKSWSATCLRCHGTGPQVLALSRTRHGVGADGRTPDCTSCHGRSEAHVTSYAAKPPDRTFDRRSTTPASVRNEACLTCHQGGKRMHWIGSAHESRDVACTNCHRIHSEHDPVRERATQPEVCFACHKEQRAEVMRPSHHPIPEGKVVCSDCHNPHGALTPKMLVRDSVNDTCYQCHMEKRGPFVRTHEPVQERCTICHNPHGSVNMNLLKLRPPWLCQQCHEPTSHRGHPALFGTGGGGTTANALARGCPNCHTNIHGTNNPSDLGTERSLRR
jgi:DmsE family decaheme c-type cytochrome